MDPCVSRTLKVLLVSSSGGHLSELLSLQECFLRHEHHYILNKRILLPPKMIANTTFVTHSERDLKLIINLFEAFYHILRLKPNIIVTAGAGISIPFALVARLFNIRVLYIETLASISRPSLTGRLIYPLANIFIYRWIDLSKYFPRGIFIPLNL